HMYRARVHPVPDERPRTGDTLGLRQLGLVVREDEVRAAAVDVHGLPEQPAGHRRALDVPSGTAPPPGTLPPGFPLLPCLPQDEVEGVVLVRVLGMTASLGGQLHHLLAG